jgi:hypothetical protein
MNAHGVSNWVAHSFVGTAHCSGSRCRRPQQEAVSEFASPAAVKLRKQHSLASEVLVFVQTSPFRKGPQYNRSVVVPLVRPSANTSELTRAAVMGLHPLLH